MKKFKKVGLIFLLGFFLVPSTTRSEPVPPGFITYIDFESDPSSVEICFVPSEQLQTDPIITMMKINGKTISFDYLNPLESSEISSNCQDTFDSKYCINYSPSFLDKNIAISIEEDPDNSIVPESPGTGIAYFTIDPDYEYITSFSVDNIEGGYGIIYDNLCGELASMECDPDVLSGFGFDDKNIPIEIVKIDSTDIPEFPGTRVSDIYDFRLFDGVYIANGKTVKLSFPFVLSEGNKSGFDKGEVTFEVYYYNSGSWKTDVISNPPSIVWDSTNTSETKGKLVFSTSHLTIFAASSDYDRDSKDKKSGGCSLSSGGDYDLLTGIANILIIFLPTVIVRFKKFLIS